MSVGWVQSPFVRKRRDQMRCSLAALPVEQVRVGWHVEKRIVELEREAVAAVFRALRLGRPALDPAHIDALGWLVSKTIQTTFRLNVRRDDFALKLAADLCTLRGSPRARGDSHATAARRRTGMNS